MDLASVKTLVKRWEKAFKAQNRREPTKEDIKQDPSGIASQYALYRKLTKANSVTSLHPPSSEASTSSSHRRSSGSFTRTPQSNRNPSDPITPTPPQSRPSRPASVQHVSSFTVQLQRMASQDSVNGHGSEMDTRSLKRKASKAVIEASPMNGPLDNGRTLSEPFVTPKKPKSGYTGPIHDPNPFAISNGNPFTVSLSPAKNSPLRPKPSPEAGPSSQPHVSPFLHVGSPHKLKSVLEANSLKKVRERGNAMLLSPSKKGLLNGITPRTKARKRLLGEDVDTPMKQKAPRRQRGQARINSKVDEDNGIFGTGTQVIDTTVEEGLDDEDEFGPSPARPPPGSKAFRRLFDGDDEDAVIARPDHIARTNQDQSALNGLGADGRAVPPSPVAMFDRQRQDVTEEMTGPQSLNDHSAEGLAVASVQEAQDDAEPTRLSTPPAMPEVEQMAASQSSQQASQRPSKTLNWSDDEEDEWNPEGGRIRRRVVITATRPATRTRQGYFSDEDLGEPDETALPEPNVETMPTLVEETTATLPSGVLASPLLSLLSLRSPTRPSRAKEARLADLRVKALFNPADAARLKAVQKGQEVHEAGEGFAGEGEGEEWMERYGMGLTDNGDRGGPGGDDPVDDDWESESDGWKRAARRMDDDGDW